MRVCIAGAGNVGRSIARELIANGHQALLIDKDRAAIKPDSVPGAAWLPRVSSGFFSTRQAPSQQTARIQPRCAPNSPLKASPSGK